MSSKYLILSLASLLLAGCSSNDDVSTEERIRLSRADHVKMQITQETQCQSLKMAIGQEFAITLPSNPSTGYSWAIVNQPNFLQALGSETQKVDPANNKGLVGQEVLATWNYRAAMPGSGKLEMAYKRTWETDITPQKTFTCTLTVE